MLKKNAELLQLECCHRRNGLVTSSLKRRYYNLSRGFAGEAFAYQYLKAYGDPDWQIIYDYWYGKGNRDQADFIVLTTTALILIEVKNYDGHFEYRDGQAYLHDKFMADDIMIRMSQRMKKFKQMIVESGVDFELLGFMVFSGEDSSVEIDISFEFDIVMRNEWRRMVKMIANHHSGEFNSSKVIQLKKELDKYELASPFEPYTFSKEEIMAMPKGLPCDRCGCFQMITAHRLFVCADCGHQEWKSAVILRAIQQLHVIFAGMPDQLSVTNIYQFIGAMAHRETVRKIYRRYLLELKSNHLRLQL